MLSVPTARARTIGLEPVIPRERFGSDFSRPAAADGAVELGEAPSRSASSFQADPDFIFDGPFDLAGVEQRQGPSGTERIENDDSGHVGRFGGWSVGVQP